MSILKRTALYSTKGGQVKFLDWAITQTSVGACAEPFTVNERLAAGANFADFDPSDIMVKVDDLMRVDDEGAAIRQLSHGDGMPLHGGNVFPRVTIFTGNERGAG